MCKLKWNDSMKDHRLYKWKAINKNGSLEEGISLETQTHLVYENIIQSGLQPVSVKLYRSMTQSYRQKEYLINFTRQLATLLQAGLPLVNSLQLLAKDIAKRHKNSYIICSENKVLMSH
ncbi:hypothetical protein BJP41_05635 [Candidatus Williamhamiltonella defendens]|uniref:Type II secretion system protein GspF domain-containing protein n=2 Tax=Candidatus Williamhamiltonella defendens TaxID=138072 RepID=A0A2D3T248_9ENTR|nr:hypothetical protein BJP41_05635 [Candidatus Hamiltonella defensa]